VKENLQIPPFQIKKVMEIVKKGMNIKIILGINRLQEMENLLLCMYWK
jgi:hypothetical protein